MLQRKQTLAQIVSDRIKTFIAENNCQPGDRLPTEKEIIHMLGVSRTVVRESLKALQSQGIIEIKQGVGIFVKEVQLQSFFKEISPFLKLDQAKFKELIDTRIILELGAVELAVRHYQPDMIKRLSYWNELIYEKASQGDRPKEEDLHFHNALFKATGNETFIQLSSIIAEYFHMNQLEKIVPPDEYLMAFKEHQTIIEAIIQQDIAQAKHAMKQHLIRLYRFLED